MFPTDTDLETQFTFETESTAVDENSPFQILLLGDWSGSAAGADSSVLKPFEIDRDNFENVLRRLKISIQVDIFNDPENPVTLNFSEFDDFHPDKIFNSCPIFGELRDIRRRLLNKNTFEDAAREARYLFNQSESTVLPIELASSVSNISAVPDSKNLLDQILFQSDKSSVIPKPRPHSEELQNLVGQAIEPFLIKTDENEQGKLLSAIDAASSRLMLKILSSPNFKDLESAWRGLYFLVKNIETDSHLKIFICDITKEELSRNLQSVKDLSDSYLHRLLFSTADYNLKASPWSLLGGNYSFDANVDDAALLIRLAQLAASARAPFISYFSPESLGISLSSDGDEKVKNVFLDDTIKKLWATVRSLPESEYIGLATPRYLARMPYGSETDPIDNFNFEEFGQQSENFEYVWANPCFICVVLIAKSFQEYGWRADNNFVNELDAFPVHIYQSEDETRTSNAVEFMLTSAKIQNLLDLGVIPLFSMVNSDKIKVFRFQSINSSARLIKGKWNHS